LNRVLWKAKIGRWRGALWCDGPRRWVLSAGYRRAGDADDFYLELGERARRWRAEYNRVHAPPLRTDTWRIRSCQGVTTRTVWRSRPPSGSSTTSAGPCGGLTLDSARHQFAQVRGPLRNRGGLSCQRLDAYGCRPSGSRWSRRDVRRPVARGQPPVCAALLWSKREAARPGHVVDDGGRHCVRRVIGLLDSRRCLEECVEVVVDCRECGGEVADR
jgi:hypothetical protein